MEISVFEIVAQIINFFVLLFVLNWVFYKPVTKAMDDRQKRIFKAQKEADQKMSQAEMLIDNYKNKIKNVEDKKQEIFSTYEDEALLIKENLLSKYKEEAEVLRLAYLDEVNQEKDNFISDLRQELGSQAVEIAKKILSTISSQDLEKEIFDLFIKDIKDLDEFMPKKEVSKTKVNPSLSSYKELSKNQKAQIEKMLKASLSNIEDIEYTVDKDLIIGYQLDLETYTISNNIKTYLDIVEDNIKDLINTNQF